MWLCFVRCGIWDSPSEDLQVLSQFIPIYLILVGMKDHSLETYINILVVSYDFYINISSVTMYVGILYIK